MSRKASSSTGKVNGMGPSRTATLLLAFTITTTLWGFINAQGVGSKDLFRCRQSCYQKFVQDWHHCMDFEDCKNMCITPPNINSYIPEAFSFLCWNNCDQQLGPFPLNINSALRQGSLVLTNIAWDQAITNASKQCLVTWEVSGGGLMGNLLTDSSTVELSLWPETVYHVQVTCKHKETGGMRRSYKLIVDTHKLSDSTATGMQAITLETTAGSKGMPQLYGAGAAGGLDTSGSALEADSRMRILKDSSKDFLTPYNPNANVASSSNNGGSKNVKITTTKVSSSNSDVNLNKAQPAHNSVFRTKLNNARPLRQSMNDLLAQSVALAVLGALLLFLVVLALYFALRRPASKKLPPHCAAARTTDKEVLIHNELLPSQTTSAVACHNNDSSNCSRTAALQAVLATAGDTQTLHV